MILQKLHTHIALLLAAVGAVMPMASCSDELPDTPDYTRSGEDVTLKVSLALPKMEVRSRADLGEDELNRVNSLWVRTYSAETGEATSDWVVVTDNLPTVDTEVARPVTIRSKSGYSYIVAVANVENRGVTRGNTAETFPLSRLLDAADTWEQFLDIAALTPSTQASVRAPQEALTMVGCYSDLVVGGTHPEPTRISDWQSRDFQPYFIPAQQGVVNWTGNGAIHLRRLVSHVNFNVKPYDASVLSVTVNSFQVMNAPRYSWLYERPATNGMTTNFGDLATSAENAQQYYVDVPQYGSQFITENPDKSSSFDFWQGENKHSALNALTTYGQRGEKTQASETAPVLFTPLTGNTWTANNEASYVLISCTVEYAAKINVNQQGEVVNNGNEVNRTGDVVYLIHLGALGENYSDFNCFRNVNYTYNITVNGLNDIRVDAYATEQNPEQYHNQEGMVVDISDATIDIDAHYAAFNIQLTAAEMTGDFGFMIIAYENGIQYTITDANEQVTSGNTTDILDANGNAIDPKYYNWIELRATTGQNVLAEYRPRYGYNYANNEKRTFLLTDLKGGYNSLQANQRSDDNGWYTVFVNEYTYEPMYTGATGYANETWNHTGQPAWMSYVNQNPRRFYIRVTQTTSPDGKSIYARSKYGISQQSMMSYYSDGTITNDGTAIGVERRNETLGMNLRHNFAGGTSTSNGRWNTGMWLNNANTTSTNLSINNNNTNQRPQWTNYVRTTTPLTVGAVTDLRTQGGPRIDGGTYPLPGVALLTGQTFTFNDPQGSNNYTIEAINACMSRNRDNNGNGRIEPDELRWYVPGMDQYLHMMLGSKSMPEPMIEYQTITSLPHVANNSYQWTENNNYRFKNDYASRYMYISSNNGKNVMWTMEGTSTSSYGDIAGWAGTTIRPWQIRCIRNLGSNLTTVINDNKVDPAYVHNAANHTFAMRFYDLASIRANTYTGNGSGASQMPVHTIASSYNSTYYGFEYATTDITVPAESRPAGQDNFTPAMTNYINGNPCGATGTGLTGTGWRVPNQEELTIMRNAGLFSTGYNYSDMFMSCTVNYFNATTGAGNMSTDGKLFLVVNPGNGTQATTGNIKDAGTRFYIRCVRDVMP